jgi:uncharacterized membrane protein YgcG
MSEDDMMEHEAHVASNEESGRTERLIGILRSRYFAIGVTLVVLLAGFLLARRFGIGGRVLPGVGLLALMMVSHSFMHRGHGSHGGHSSDGGHGGCGTSSQQRLQSKPDQHNGAEPKSRDNDEIDPPYSPRGHSGCH